VPYKGGAPANQDLLAGRIQVVFSPLVEVLPFLESGRLRALGVTTAKRSPRLPDVPAIAEVLPGYEVALWNGIFAPAGTPPEVVKHLAGAVSRVLKQERIRTLFAGQGTEPVGNTPEAFEELLPREIEHWAKLVEISGAKIE
jgi:tripartite-type tricarboxylate transporter receptor subunit TctC